MLKPYRTFEDVLRSPWAAMEPPREQPATDRVLRSTKLEDSIYADLRDEDGALEQTEQEAAEKLPSFPALSRDVFQSFYSLMPRKNEGGTLSVAAQKFNGPILDHITQSEDYPTLKTVCEGRELPAYEAASEFITRTAGELDHLLADIGGEKNGLSTLEKLEKAESEARKELSDLLKRMQTAKERNQLLEQSVVDAANKAESKRRQVEAVGKLVDANAARSKDDVAAMVAMAMSAAAEKAEEVQSIIGAWSDDPGNLERNEVNAELLALVRKSPVLRDIAKYLSRFGRFLPRGNATATPMGGARNTPWSWAGIYPGPLLRSWLCWPRRRPRRCSCGSISGGRSSNTSAGSPSTRAWAISSAVWMNTPSFYSFGFETVKDTASCRAFHRNLYCRRFQRIGSSTTTCALREYQHP